MGVNLGYPKTAAALGAAVGYGAWVVRWAFDEASGNARAAFGSPDLTPNITTSSKYGAPGLLSGSDKAVHLVGGDNFNCAPLAVGTGDFAFAMICKLSGYGPASSVRFSASNTFGGGDPGWSFEGDNGGPIVFLAFDAVGAIGVASIPVANFPQDKWVLVMVAGDRASGKWRAGVRSFDDGATYVTAEASFGLTTMTSAGATYIGSFTINCGLDVDDAMFGFGVGAGSGLSANLPTALANLAKSILDGSGYARMMGALLPPGKVWRRANSVLANVFEAGALELARLEVRVNDLFNEADPSTAIELLPEYERELTLASTGTNAERQARIVARTIARQRYRPSDFQTALAPLLGQLPAAVVVLERTNAFAVSIGDVREIYRFFIYRDPTLPGTYFLASAQALVDQIKPSHTIGQVIESVSFLCDDAFSLCDRDLLGA